MRALRFVCQLTILINAIALAQSIPVPLINKSLPVVRPISTSRTDPKAESRILDSYGKLQLSFEANHGQADPQVKFLSRIGGYSLFLTRDEAVLAFSGKKAGAKVNRSRRFDAAAPKAGSVLRMKLRNANPAAKVTGVDELAGTSNYFIGNDPAKWFSNLPTYAKVKYEGIYSGIDLVYYGNQRQLEYDFIVAPGADPRRIALDVGGTKRIRRDAHGDLALQMSEGEIRWHKPVVYQERNGARQEIAARYTIRDTNRVRFEVAKYDESRPLYIDPLIYSTYLGGSGDDGGSGIAVDSAGNAYVTGYTQSADFPTTPGVFQTVCGGGCTDGEDAFIAKINPTGSALVYSTYLGGSRGDGGSGITVDSLGNAYVTGGTGSTDFPTTTGAFQTVCGVSSSGYCFDGFVAKINPTGSALVYSTYLGGSGDDSGYQIAVDSSGNAHVTGYTASTDFPTMNPFQSVLGGGEDAFIAKINPTGSALVYSTYLGGSGGDGGFGIDLDAAGNAYVTGLTGSTDFPTTPGAFQTVCGGCNGSWDAFVAKINPTGSALVYSTYLGGSEDDEGWGIAVDSSGEAYVTGYTGSTDFPTMNPLQPTYGRGILDAFVAKLNPTGSALVYSTYLGGSEDDRGFGIAVDSAGNAYVTGTTTSNNFPTESPAQRHRGGSNDAFVSKLNPGGSALVYSTYMGGLSYDSGNGIAVDSAGNAYVTGTTQSTNFPTKSPLQPSNAGGYADAFVAQIDTRAATTTVLSSSPNPSTYGQSVTFTVVITSRLGAPPDGETVTFKQGTTVLGTAVLGGGAADFSTSTLGVGTKAVTAVYGGDSSFHGSTSKATRQMVSKATTTTTLVSSQNPSNLGQSVTFTASIAPQLSGKVTGTVTFYDGTTLLKTVPVSGGAANFTTLKLASGQHTITATYKGSTSFDGSSSPPLTQTVD
jgi:hypothetical protein